MDLRVVGGLDQQTKFFSFLCRYNNGFMQNSYAPTEVILDNEIQCQIIQLEPANKLNFTFMQQILRTLHD